MSKVPSLGLASSLCVSACIIPERIPLSFWQNVVLDLFFYTLLWTLICDPVSYEA
jgi:hypothetical protein